MGRLLFFLFGLPIMIVTITCTSFVDILNYDFKISATYNGNEVILEQEQQDELKNILVETFSNSHDIPTIFVTTNDTAKEQMQDGYYLNLKFKEKVSFNDYIFDELAFLVENESSQVCMLRGNNGNFEGRCLYFILENDMSNVYNYLNNLNENKEVSLENKIQEESNQEEVKEEKNETVEENLSQENNETRQINSPAIMKTQII